MTLSGGISNQRCITVDITDENGNKIGDCSFTINSNKRGVDMQLYIGSLEVKTSSLDMSGIHEDVTVEILPQREVRNYNDYLPNDFEFDIDIVVHKHFNGTGAEHVRKVRKIIRNVSDVYKMIKEY